MDSAGKITIKFLQEYIKSKDHHPDLKKEYFIKISEEVGELARAVIRNSPPATETDFKGTVEGIMGYNLLCIGSC